MSIGGLGGCCCVGLIRCFDLWLERVGKWEGGLDRLVGFLGWREGTYERRRARRREEDGKESVEKTRKVNDG